MRFCSGDGAVMKRSFAGAEVRYVCPRCHGSEPALPSELNLMSFSHANAGAALSTNVIATAAFDRTCLQVRRSCKCGRDYMSQIRLGDTETVIYRCRCGASETV